MNALHILSASSNIYSFAFTLVIVGMVVVFIALALLVIILNNIPVIGKFFTRFSQSALKKPVISSRDNQIPAQVSAAISAAIFLYLDEIHDKESRVMTIRKVSKSYSPWSSKIYGLNILRK